MGILWDDENYEFIFNFKEVLEIANNFNITKRNEIMELSTDEQEITNIVVAGTEFKVKVQETLSVIEKVLTDEFRMLNIEDPDRLRSISARLQRSRKNAAIVGELRRQSEGSKAIEPWRGNVSYIKIVKSLNICFLLCSIWEQ